LLGAASAAPPSAFTATVGAQGTHITISNDAGSIPTFNELDAGLSTAQASLGSLGNSSATASNPDAGVVGTLPGVVETLLPQLLPSLLKIKLPITPPPIDYPLTASAQNGQAPQTVGTGPVKLSASASETSATAKAVVGGTADGTSGAGIQTSIATTSIAADGTATATATTAISALDITNLITLGQIRSTASVTREPDGSIKRSSSMSVGFVDVAGLKAQFADGNLLLAGTKTPLSIATLNTALHTLSGGHMTLTFQKAQQTPNGIISPLLELIINAPKPPKCVRIKLPTPIISGVAYCGVTTITYDVGRADASISYTVAPTIAPPASTSPVSSPPVGSSVLPSTGPLTNPGGVSLPSTSGTSGIPSSGGTAPQVANGGSQSLIQLAAQKQLDFTDVYAAIIGLAILGIAAATCLRYLGVRDKWTS
jgi:hypothetical protein